MIIITIIIIIIIVNPQSSARDGCSSCPVCLSVSHAVGNRVLIAKHILFIIIIA